MQKSGKNENLYFHGNRMIKSNMTLTFLCFLHVLPMQFVFWLLKSGDGFSGNK